MRAAWRFFAQGADQAGLKHRVEKIAGSHAKNTTVGFGPEFFGEAVSASDD